MNYRVSKRLIEAVCNHLIEVYLPQNKKKVKSNPEFNDKDLRFFAKGVGALSLAFTRERNLLPKNYLNLKEYRSAYILYFVIPNYLKSLFCLDEIKANGKFTNEVRMLDIGCGPGTSAFAAIEHFKDTGAKIDFTGIDQNDHILRDLKSLLRRYGETKISVNTINTNLSCRNLENITHNKTYDIIFLSNILSEFKDFSARQRLVQDLIRSNLHKDGYIVIIEPALRKTTRELMELRDRLLSGCDDHPSIVSPCFHELPCPMLSANRRDWCHLYVEWERPLLIEKIDRMIGNRKDYLKFSYLILKKSEAGKRSDDIWRVVSSPLRSKGKTELLVCNKKGLVRLMRLDRFKSKANQTFDRLKRGDVIKYAGPAKLIKESFLQFISPPR